MTDYSHPLIRYFATEHLPAHLERTSQPFQQMAHTIDAQLPEGPEKGVALRKLLEAKDAAVRSALDIVTDPNVPRSTAYGVTHPSPHVPRTMMDCAECHIVHPVDELTRTSSGEYVCTGCAHEDRYPG